MAANELEDRDQKLWRLKEDYLRALDEYEKGRLDYINELIESEKVKAKIEELERLHRYQGKDLPLRDYDNETDELIDERIEELESKEEAK